MNNFAVQVSDLSDIPAHFCVILEEPGQEILTKNLTAAFSVCC